MMIPSDSNSNRLLPKVAFAARWLVGGLFVLTGVAKIAGLERFVEEVRAYDLLPLVTTNAVGYFVPWLEVAAGALLVLCLWQREARAVIAAMLVAFTIAKGYAFARGLNIECGCGGGIAFLKYIFDLPQGILTNLGLLGLLWIDSRAQRRAELAEKRPARKLSVMIWMSRRKMVRFLPALDKGLLGMNWKARGRSHSSGGTRTRDLAT